MRRGEELLLEAVAAAIRGKQVCWQEEISAEDWELLLHLARQQHVLPMVLNSVYRCDAYQRCSAQMQGQLKQEVRGQMLGQSVRTQELLRLTELARTRQLPFVVMKGYACRRLYPVPDARPSSDEDLLVPPQRFGEWVEFLLSAGYVPRKKDFDLARDHELGFVSKHSYLELHRTPFDPGSGVMQACNRFFEGACARSRTENESGVPLMEPCEHMLYLILHAFKHLIHSGVGLRQVCDIVLWGERYREEIDWGQLCAQCEQVRCLGFAAAVFAIGRQYLGLEQIPEPLERKDVPWQGLLNDLLSGGVYGGADLGRIHSSTITLRAVEASYEGERPSLTRTLFPAREQLSGDYPYLKRWPALLPAAWAQRLLRYAGEVAKGRDARNNPTQSLRIGQQRKQLLQQLDILDQEK